VAHLPFACTLTDASSFACLRPVITSRLHTDGDFASNHIDVLGSKGFYFSDCASLVELLMRFDRSIITRRDWNAFRKFEPKQVMVTFEQVFLAEPRVATGTYDIEEACRAHARLVHSAAKMPCCGK
jgi:hypothetical protein